MDSTSLSYQDEIQETLTISITFFYKKHWFLKVYSSVYVLFFIDTQIT